MRLNVAERWLVNNPARALVQRWYEVPLLLRLGGRVSGGRVLEIGCGRGRALPLLLSRFGASSVVGIDVDPDQAARAAGHNRQLTSVAVGVASADQLPFPGSSFDAVFDFGILHHVERWQRAVEEVRRVLKPGGTFFFEEVTRAALERWTYRTWLDHPRLNRFSEEEFLEELRTHDLLPGPTVHRVFFGDIFIGVARRTPANIPPSPEPLERPAALDRRSALG